MAMQRKVVAAILGVVIAGILLGTVFPVGLDQVNQDPSYNVTLEESTEQNIQVRLNATLTSVTTGAPDTATIQIKDTETGTTESQTIDNGSTVQYNTLEGGYVNVTVNNVSTATAPNSSEVTIVAEQGFAWDDSSQDIFSVLGLFLVIVPLIVLAKQTMEA